MDWTMPYQFLQLARQRTFFDDQKQPRTAIARSRASESPAFEPTLHQRLSTLLDSRSRHRRSLRRCSRTMASATLTSTTTSSPPSSLPPLSMSLSASLPSISPTLPSTPLVDKATVVGHRKPRPTTVSLRQRLSRHPFVKQLRAVIPTFSIVFSSFVVLLAITPTPLQWLGSVFCELSYGTDRFDGLFCGRFVSGGDWKCSVLSCAYSSCSASDTNAPAFIYASSSPL